MLLGIDKLISPELIKILMEMGHGDEIVLADGNFPSANYANRLVRMDGHGVPEVLNAILKLIPLDSYVKEPVALMSVVKGDPYEPVIWDTYIKSIEAANGKTEIEHMERFAFYERAKKAYAIVATSEGAIYANLIVKKGVVK